ncbi:MAG: hypothetical protein E7266_08970 [Lachnospiraceae bacterium]|nr:hypothetical protein [Lachnospiraceae bacterium]
MLSKILALGNRVELIGVKNQLMSAVDEELENSRKIYYSQIYDIIDESKLRIAMPIEGGKVIPLSINSRYDACFFTSSGLYQCRVVVVERYKEDNIYVLVVEIVTELQKYQRRQFYRLGCTMDIKYCTLEKEEVEEYFTYKFKEEFAHKLKLTEAIVLDISGGGMRFISDMKHQKESDVYILLDISYEGDERVYGILGKIIYMERVKNRPGLYEYRVEYQGIEGSVRENIIRFIFEEERKQRKKAKSIEDE